MKNKNFCGLIGSIALFLLSNRYTKDFISDISTDIIYSNSLWLILTTIIYFVSLIGLFFIIFFSVRLILAGLGKESALRDTNIKKNQ